MITFSRAPGIIIFGGVCFGILILDIIRLKESSLTALEKIKYLYFTSVAFIFALIYFTGRDANRKWGDTTIGVNPKHIFHLFKQYTISNFLWIFFILAISYVLYIYMIKKESLLSTGRSAIFVILISDLLLFTFYCVVITYRIPRYMDSHIASLYILGTLALLSLKDGFGSVILSSIICIVSLVGSFRTIDPVSLAVFNRINVGDHDIIDFEMTEHPSFEDTIIYNREYYSYEVLLGKALEYAINDRKAEDDILFSLGDQRLTWGFSGGRYSYSYSDGRTYFPLFYDKVIHGLANGYAWDYNSSDDMIPFEMRYIFPEETLDMAVSGSSSDTFYYIYMPTLNYDKEAVIDQRYSVIDKKEFDFRGWKMNCIIFRR